MHNNSEQYLRIRSGPYTAVTVDAEILRLKTRTPTRLPRKEIEKCLNFEFFLYIYVIIDPFTTI